MVRFGEDLEKAIFPIWRSYYIDYARLKKVLEFVRETYPYLDLLEKHDVIVLNDPSRPFELVMAGVIFTFTDVSGSTNKNCVLKITMHDTRLPLEHKGGGLRVNDSVPTSREDTRSAPEERGVYAVPEGYSLFIELDEARAGLLVSEVDLSCRFTASTCLRPHTKGYAMRLREKFLKDLASLKIGKEIADSVGGAVMTLFLDGSSASKAKDRGGVSPRLAAAAVPQSEGPASPSGVKGVVKDLTTLIGGITAEQREEIRVKREEAKAVPKQFKILGSALDGRPTTMSSFLPSHVSPLYHNPALIHALYLYHLEVSNILSQALKEEVEKVSNFYISQSHVICGTALLCADAVKNWRDLSAKERSQIRIAFRQTYSTLDMLQQFCDMNCLAIAKILKKYDKRTHQQMLTDYKHSIENVIFKMGHDSRIHRLQKSLNAVFSRHVMKGDHKQGLSYLDSRETVSGRATELSLAVLIGIVGTMAVVLFNHVFTMGGFDGGPGTSVFPPNSAAAKYGITLIFIPFILALWAFLFSINVMVWEHFGINFAFMFELDPIFHWTGTELMRDSLMYVLAWMLCVYQFLLWNTHESLCMANWDVNTVTDAPVLSSAGSGFSSMSSSASSGEVGATVVSAAATALNAIGSSLFSAQNFNSTTSSSYIPELSTGTAPLVTSFTPPREVVDNTSIAPLYWVFPIWIAIFICKATFNHFFFNNRKPWIAITVWRSISIPLYQVKFSEFIICNNIASITGWFFEMGFYFCPLVGASADAFCGEYRAKSICAVSILPSWWRLLQCFRRYYDQPKATRKPFPNLINAGKYATGCIALILWNFYYTAKYEKTFAQAELDVIFAWVVGFQIFTQFYYYAWDIVVDAGIWIRHDDGVWRLREEKVYGVWWPYVCFCILNILLTSTWALKLAIAPYIKNRPYMWVIWTSIEVTRRSYWNFMRVENEHVNNTEGYRATRFAPIPAKRIVAWDAMAEDLTERFLRTDKEKASEEFPDIKGVNFTGVTKFYANLPEDEQFNILRGLNLKAKEGSASGTLDGHVYVDGTLKTVITTIGADGRQYGTHLPCLDPSLLSEHTASVHLPSVIFSQHSAGAANATGKISLGSGTGSSESGAIATQFVDKAKFFSELPEEIKVCLVLEYLGVDETMNAYLKRVTGSEIITSRSNLLADGGSVGKAAVDSTDTNKDQAKKKRKGGNKSRKGGGSRALSAIASPIEEVTALSTISGSIAAAAAADAANTATNSVADNLLLVAGVSGGKGGAGGAHQYNGLTNVSVSTTTISSFAASQMASDRNLVSAVADVGTHNVSGWKDSRGVAVLGAGGKMISVAPLQLKSIASVGAVSGADVDVSVATTERDDSSSSGDEDEDEESSGEGEDGDDTVSQASATNLLGTARGNHGVEREGDTTSSDPHDVDGDYDRTRYSAIKKIPVLTPGAMLAMAFNTHDEKEAKAPLPPLSAAMLGGSLKRANVPEILSSEGLARTVSGYTPHTNTIPLPPNPFGTTTAHSEPYQREADRLRRGDDGEEEMCPVPTRGVGHVSIGVATAAPSASEAVSASHVMGATLPPEGQASSPDVLLGSKDITGIDT